MNMSTKKTILGILCLLVGQTLALENMRPIIDLAFETESVLVTLDFSRIQEGQWTEMLAQPENIHEAGYGLAGKAGDPALPLFTTLIPVLSLHTPTVSVLSNSQHRLPIQSLKKTPGGHLETDPPLNIQNYVWSENQAVTPFSVSLGDPVHLMGQTYLPLTITPLQMDENLREVLVPDELVLRIQGITPAGNIALDSEGSVRSVIPNDDIYEDLGHYLIITPPLFEPYLGYLVDWKKRKGHPVTVISTDVAGQSPTAIKAFIQETYDTWEIPPHYVLLIGDEDRGIGGFYVYNPDNEALVTDHPYVLLEGEDSFPEAWIGRLSVDTISELATVISKILSYESQPSLNDPGWFKRALMVCTTVQAISTQQTNNWVSRKLRENGFTQVDTAYYPMQSSLGHISNPINNGVGFVNYRGLGAWDHWIGPYFYNSHIDQLHNGNKLPIMTSIVCGGGNFAAPVDPVFGEKWIRAGTSSVPKGAVAFIGPSEIHTHTQFNNVIDIALYSAFFDLDIRELGPALWHAKLELWRNYYQSEYLPYGQSADFYQNVYNILGDPGMAVWTDTPQNTVVDFPDNLSMSDDHLSISVQDAQGMGISDAYVYLYNASNAVGLRTDASGSVTLPFTPGVEAALLLTVTGKNLNPVLESIPILNDQGALSHSQWEPHPDGQLLAGATQSFNLTLDNNLADLDELTLTLSSPNEYCTISDATFSRENFDIGTSLAFESIFEFSIDAQANHGEVIAFEISVDTGDEIILWQKSFPVQAPVLNIADIEILSTGYAVGDSIQFRLSIQNIGGLDCLPSELTFMNQALLWSHQGTINCPVVLIDQVVQVEGSLILSDQIFPGEMLDLAFESSTQDGVDTLHIGLQFEPLNRFAPSLPDAYGYRVYDETDVSYSLAPVYDWIEIDPALGGSGSHLPINDQFEEADAKVEIDLPFPVHFYGQIFQTATICSNGWMSFGSTPEYSFYNRVIPSAEGPTAMIAPFWDDLITDPGSVSYANLVDKLVIEWSRMSHLEINSTLNFQVIIYNTNDYPTASGDNDIKMQFMDYYDYDTFANFSTTGIESPDYTTGLQVSFNKVPDVSVGLLEAGRALLFTTERAERYAPAIMRLNQYGLNFNLNPWSLASDSIAIMNLGGSPLVYNFSPIDEEEPEPAPNPLAGFEAVKGGPEPDGSQFIQSQREMFDYEWFGQDDPEGPEFSWWDIAQPENEVAYTGDPDDSSIGPIALGFEFPFYAELYSQFYFSSNGTISFASAEYPWNNLTLPNGSAPPALIAPWWDDLNNNEGIQGVPYFWSNGEDVAVITWDNFPKFGTQDFHTFQVVLVANGDILFQYLDLHGSRTVSTVGIQNVEKNKGVLIYYNIPNDLEAGDAILIRRKSNWLIIREWSGRVEVGETGHFSVDIDTRNLDPGSFSFPLLLETNAANLLESEIGINLNVIHGTPPYGDVNADYQLNIIDLTALI